MQQMITRVKVGRLAVAGVLLVAALAVPAFAKKKQQSQQQQQQQAPPQQPPTTQGSNTEQQQALSDAVKELAAANASLKEVIQKERTTFESSADFAAAKQDQTTAKAAYDAASMPVLEKVDASPDYVSAVASKKDAQNKLDALRQNNGSPDEIQAAAQQSMQASAQARQLEQSALEEDPNITALKAKLDASNAKVAQMRLDFNKNLQTDTEYVSAKSAVDAANKKVAAAQAALASAH